jgi:hypothetical protein
LTAKPRIHIHEDDWAMRFLAPVAALDDMDQEFDKSKAHQAAHTDAHGNLTRPYGFENTPLDYSSIPLMLADAAAILEAFFPRVRDFVATASAGFEAGANDPYGLCETDAYCFGTSWECFVKLEHKDGIVRQIWFECWTKDKDDIARLRNALLAIDAVIPSALSDHWVDACGPVGDAEFMDEYFAALEAQPR